MVNLSELENALDNALAKETKESLEEFFKNKMGNDIVLQKLEEYRNIASDEQKAKDLKMLEECKSSIDAYEYIKDIWDFPNLIEKTDHYSIYAKNGCKRIDGYIIFDNDWNEYDESDIVAWMELPESPKFD